MSLIIASKALAAGSGRRLGDEEPPAQFLHIDDLAAAIETVAVSEYDGVVNVAPDGWVPGDRVRALLGRRWQIPVPRWVREQLWALQWRFQRGPIPPGLGPYTTTSWVVANDRLKSLGGPRRLRMNRHSLKAPRALGGHRSPPNDVRNCAWWSCCRHRHRSFRNHRDGVRRFASAPALAHCTHDDCRNDRYGHGDHPGDESRNSKSSTWRLCSEHDAVLG